MKTKTEQTKTDGKTSQERVSEQEYIEQWSNHIKPLWNLAFTPSEELNNEVADAIRTLENALPKIAKVKELKN